MMKSARFHAKYITERVRDFIWASFCCGKYCGNGGKVLGDVVK